MRASTGRSSSSGGGRKEHSGADSRIAKRLAAHLPDRYIVERVIGSGGAAYVIHAYDSVRNHPLAVKILRPELATIIGEKRFHREIEILSHLDHPNILPLLDFGSVDARIFYFTMPLVKGETLRTEIHRRRHLSLGDTIAIAEPIASALDYAHGRGLIHRDVKPANILLDADRVIVADFGIARAMAVRASEQLTLSGISLGTPEYMSPEQAGGVRELDARCDVYAMGCMVYEMLTGRPPFTGKSAGAILARQTNETPESIRAIRPEIPAGVDAAIAKALAKSRAQRFYTAGQFRTALAEAALEASA